MEPISLNDILARHGIQKDLNDMLDKDPGALETPSPAVPAKYSPSSGSKESAPSASKLPMRRTKPAGGSCVEKPLDPERLAALKAEVADAQSDTKSKKKAELAKGKAKAAAKEGGSTKTGGEVTKEKIPSRRGLEAKTVCKQFLDSLATPAPKSASSKKKPATKTQKAKAKAKAKSKGTAEKKASLKRKHSKVASEERNGEEDLEDEEEDSLEEMNVSDVDSELSKETLMLPGKGDEQNDDQNDPNDQSDQNDETETGGCDKSASTPVDMRGMYWKVVHEAQAKIRKANPELSGREILKMARAEWENHPERINIIKNMSANDLSKRRLKPDLTKKEPTKKRSPKN